jgi:DNA-binding PadR family transcriptional regulator
LSTSELTPFSYAVLVLVGEGGAGAHDLVRMARQGRVYWDAAEGQWYAEPKRLAARGYLVARKEPGRTRERTHYVLADRGREALRAWLREPARWPRMQLEPVVRLLAADLVGEEVVLASLAGLRTEIADVEARTDVAESVAATLPHRERYLLLAHGLARRLLAAHREWLDDVERELATPASRGASAPSSRGRRR